MAFQSSGFGKGILDPFITLLPRSIRTLLLSLVMSGRSTKTHPQDSLGWLVNTQSFLVKVKRSNLKNMKSHEKFTQKHTNKI